MAVSIALILMVGALGVGALVVLAVIAVDVHRGVGIGAEILRFLDGRKPGEPLPTVPCYPPRTPQQYAADARAFAEQHARVDPSFGAYKPVEVTRDSDAMSTSAISPDQPIEMRALGGEPALWEDDNRPAWEPSKSGTWPKGGGG